MALEQRLINTIKPGGSCAATRWQAALVAAAGRSSASVWVVRAKGGFSTRKAVAASRILLSTVGASSTTRHRRQREDGRDASDSPDFP